MTTTMTATRRWQPSFPERWRHGGWYTNNRYPQGGCGCVHNNHVDCPGKRWFVAGSEDELGGFSSRTEAAYAERCMLLEDRLTAIVKQLEELAEIGEGGVIERRETGTPTWSALDAVKTIARDAIAKATGNA